MGPSRRALAGLVLLFIVVSSSSASVVEETCKSAKGVDYNYCIKFFQADKGSATAADKRGLAVIAAKITGALAKSTSKRIAALKSSAKDKRVKMALSDCDDVYSQAVDELSEAADGIKAGTPGGKSDANTFLSGAANAPETCETSFSELGVKSPLAAEDSEFSREVLLALAITNSL